MIDHILKVPTKWSSVWR